MYLHQFQQQTLPSLFLNKKIANYLSRSKKIQNLKVIKTTWLNPFHTGGLKKQV